MDFFEYIFQNYYIRNTVLKRPSNFYVVRSENQKIVYKLFKNAYTRGSQSFCRLSVWIRWFIFLIHKKTYNCLKQARVSSARASRVFSVKLSISGRKYRRVVIGVLTPRKDKKTKYVVKLFAFRGPFIWPNGGNPGDILTVIVMILRKN